MQCLESLDASSTAIKELPDSIGSLPSINFLKFGECKKLTYVPKSICNLKSLKYLDMFISEDIIKIELFEGVNDMNLEELSLSCNIRVGLPMILSFSSLRSLHLRDECGSPSPTKPFSFFQLFNFKELWLTDCTSHGSCFPELPPNLEWLYVENHASLEQVPDLSYLKHLKIMDIMRCCSLQSLHKLPPHLLQLTVEDCTSLQDFPDLSELRDLMYLTVLRNGSNLKVSLEENHLQLTEDNDTFLATVPNKEIAEWFDYKNREGCTLSFHVPPNLGDNFLGLAFWVVRKGFSHIEAVITNKTEDTTTTTLLNTSNYGRMGVDLELESAILCIRSDDFSIKKGDKIMISFEVDSFSDTELKMCAAHVLKRPSKKSLS
ncbi:disease resistance protein RPV1-like [Daucus carota subsp. sativus]|uniref:disease resistance protein RPV1-like n=1 Tax=Daucus carota subsp. sativus TaxID=79200 RepID=UPI0030836807